MKVVDHPYLEGVRLREDGAAFIPWGGRRKGSRWTFGHRTQNGYLEVQVRKRRYYVHRLMAETFLQCPIPDGMQIDHINRDKSLNALFNIRIVTPRENALNSDRSEESFKKHGVSSTDDVNAYGRAHYAANPVYREKHRAHMKAYRARKRAETAQ